MVVQKVVYAASSTYYGNQGVPFVETDGFMPTSPYAASKYMGRWAFLFICLIGIMIDKVRRDEKGLLRHRFMI